MLREKEIVFFFFSSSSIYVFNLPLFLSSKKKTTERPKSVVIVLKLQPAILSRVVLLFRGKWGKEYRI